MKRYFKVLGYLLSVHVLALLVMTLFRLVEFIALHGMIVDAGASRVMAFVKGVWFDNVIACYISVLAAEGMKAMANHAAYQMLMPRSKRR